MTFAVTSRLRDVEIMQLSNTTLRMTWKPPFSQLHNIDRYVIFTFQSNETWGIDLPPSNRKIGIAKHSEDIPEDYEKIRTFDFHPPTEHKSSIFIFPWCWRTGYGLE